MKWVFIFLLTLPVVSAGLCEDSAFMQVDEFIDTKLILEEVSIDLGSDRELSSGEHTFRAEGSSLYGEPLTYAWYLDGVQREGDETATFFLSQGTHTLSVEASTSSFQSSDQLTVWVDVARPQSVSTLFLSSPDGIRNTRIVLLNGGYETRFWNDVNRIYQILRCTYGYSDDDIILLNHDGSNPDGQNPYGMIDNSLTEQTLSDTFTALAQQMDEDDFLFLWITDHGNGYFGSDAYEPSYEGYLAGRASVQPGDEQDYLETDWKLRALFTGGTFRANHGLGTWQAEKRRSYSSVRFKRVRYESHFSMELESGLVEDNDIWIEKITDYLVGDTNKDGEISEGETIDWDADGIAGYDVNNGFDEDDWGKPDVVAEHNSIATQVPGGQYCIYDAGMDNTVDLDLSCTCYPDCGSLDIDATDSDNAGHFDRVDVNQDGDFEDWVSIDEVISLGTGRTYDDTMKELLAPFNNVFVFMLPCFSGGFIDDLSKPGRVIMTAASETDVSWGNAFTNQFAGSLVYGDLNNNGEITLQESWNYMYDNSYHGGYRLYDDVGEGIGIHDTLPSGQQGVLGSEITLLRNGGSNLVSTHTQEGVLTMQVIFNNQVLGETTTEVTLEEGIPFYLAPLWNTEQVVADLPGTYTFVVQFNDFSYEEQFEVN